MSTQGLLSVVENNKVIFKVIAFSDGDRMDQVKDWLIGNPEYNVTDLWMAIRKLFSKDSLALQISEDKFMNEFPPKMNWKPNSLYKEKFDDPCCYPCLDSDSANYTIVLDRVNDTFAERNLDAYWAEKCGAGLVKSMFAQGFKADIKELLVNLLEMEADAKSASNDQYASGLQCARINLETVLERHGISRVTTLKSEGDLCPSK